MINSGTFAISQDPFLRIYVLPCVRHRIRCLSWLDPMWSDISVIGEVCSGFLLNISYTHPSMARHILRIPYPCRLNLNICGAMAQARRDGSMGNIRGIIFVRQTGWPNPSSGQNLAHRRGLDMSSKAASMYARPASALSSYKQFSCSGPLVLSLGMPMVIGIARDRCRLVILLRDPRL